MEKIRTVSNMFTPEMLGHDGKRTMEPQNLTPEQAERQRAVAREIRKSSAGPLASVASGTEEQSGTEVTSGTEGEDSVDEFYRNHPEIPKCGQVISSRSPTPQEEIKIQARLSKFAPSVHGPCKYRKLFVL
jgi:hypothetical protein